MSARLYTVSKARPTADQITRVLEGVATGVKAATRSPEELARAKRSARFRIGAYGLGGAAAVGATAGMSSSLANRAGPARRMRIVGDKRETKAAAYTPRAVRTQKPPPQFVRIGLGGKERLPSTMSGKMRAVPAKNPRTAKTQRESLLDAMGKSFASRDQNSSVPAKTATVAVDGRHKAGSRAAVVRSSMEGRSRLPSFVRVSENSSVPVQRVQPRSPSGKFVSHANDLQVFHPLSGSRRRNQPTNSARVGVWGKGKDGQSKEFMGKAFQDGARTGRNISKAGGWMNEDSPMLANHRRNYGDPGAMGWLGENPGSQVRTRMAQTAATKPKVKGLRRLGGIARMGR